MAAKMDFATLSGTQKAAILMLLFGERGASKVLSMMTPRHVQDLGTAMYSVRGVDHETVHKVLDEFITTLRDQSSIGIGANAYVRRVLTSALGDDRAQSVLSRIAPSNIERPIEILDWMDAPAIVELLVDEHPQIIALVISALDYAVGADVLMLLPPEMQPDIIHRIATLNTVQPEALREVEEVMNMKFKANTSLRASQIGGVKAAARIMNFTKQDAENRILGTLKKMDKDLMTNLQDNMFIFDNLESSDDRSLQTLLREIDQEVLVLALKGATESLREKLFGCMSVRAAETLKDEMEALGPVRLSEVQEAQKQIVNIARTMSDEGTITLAGRGGEEMV